MINNLIVNSKEKLKIKFRNTIEAIEYIEEKYKNKNIIITIDNNSNQTVAEIYNSDCSELISTISFDNLKEENLEVADVSSVVW